MLKSPHPGSLNCPIYFKRWNFHLLNSMENRIAYIRKMRKGVLWLNLLLCLIRHSLIGLPSQRTGSISDEPQPTTHWKYDLKSLKMKCDFRVNFWGFHSYFHVSMINCKVLNQAHKESIATVALSVDNLWVFSSSHDNFLKLYSLEEMTLMHSVQITSPHIKLSSCIPMPNNKTVILGSSDNSICSYSIEYGSVHHFQGAHRWVMFYQIIS